jgi:hypothetical protein
MKIEPERVKLKNLQLEAVVRERLVKTRQAGQGLAGAVVIFKLQRLAVTL